MLQPVETLILREPWEVQPRLQELTLSLNKLLEIRDIAILEGANVTTFHAANAEGTFRYHHGTWALRDRFVGGDWAVDRSNGIETIRNEKLKLVVGFCNVDLSCVDAHDPQPRTKKGSGAERASGPGLFVNLPKYVSGVPREWLFFYLMVDDKGAVELSRPVVESGRFVAMVERLYLSDGSDDGSAVRVLDAPDAGPEFDPQIVRK